MGAITLDDRNEEDLPRDVEEHEALQFQLLHL